MKSRTLSGLLIATVVAAGLLTIATGNARAYNVSRATTFECGAGSATVYFPQLSTSSGYEYETVYYSPDLWRYTADAGWQPYVTTAPWYYAIVGRDRGIIGSWYVHPTGNGGGFKVPFWSLPSGWYAVKGYFYQGPSHWATVWGTNSTLTNSTMCYVS
jgi:hypothetical protein